ncbi:hypothetical protein H257_02638 [Aphanomyces astaci]|uniref:Uncharacterized protein n=1 Tax=Aphanomyces astaci TaxID=112090 RepID=W4H2U6_APHAT|nr:hypothetical protein H257_02638 [Aphanomyces astaci]ETV86197.1 hypothetical protein H257_02638 [Aphanomyces astaci]|eukprot:XP_009824669.1 hypothetical protein H257_02638 [Aphanomyces astaci]
MDASSAWKTSWVLVTIDGHMAVRYRGRRWWIHFDTSGRPSCFLLCRIRLDLCSSRQLHGLFPNRIASLRLSLDRERWHALDFIVLEELEVFIQVPKPMGVYAN